MRIIQFIFLVALGLSLDSATLWAKGGSGPVMDADSDWVYHPAQTRTTGRHPLLVYLSCNGGVRQDLDSTRTLADSLGWIFATCHGSRNHRAGDLNHADIMKLMHKLLADPRVDPRRVYIFGFSGAAVQAIGTALQEPQWFTGLILTCAHDGALQPGLLPQAKHLAFYMTTRERDWNRSKNEYMRDLFIQNGNQVQLVMTPGEHGPGPRSEMSNGCRWMESIYK